VKRFVYAASSSTYGDHPDLPKVEDRIGRPLSPYAVTKYANELYADVFARHFGLEVIGLRYFNVFGPRQDPNGAYAAVIPRWIGQLLAGESCSINGDGETSRDFCYVANVVQANLRAATTMDPNALGQVYNIAAGRRTTLNELFAMIRDQIAQTLPDRMDIRGAQPAHQPFRPGDVRHSQADISKAARLLGYQSTYDVKRGLAETIPFYATIMTAKAPTHSPAPGGQP
jgi:UDP-N-acetylglucosamine 4-epimerase